MIESSACKWCGKTARPNDNVCESCLAGMKKMSTQPSEFFSERSDKKTLRDEIAIFILPTVVQHVSSNMHSDITDDDVKRISSDQAYLVADAMLLRRNINRGDKS